MKRLLLVISFVSLAAMAQAQSNSDYKQLYDRLVARVGYSGVGVENLLEKWERADSVGQELYIAKAHYHFSKSRTDSVKVHANKRYLDMDPVLVLKDSLGNSTYYYNEPFFDETEYGLGLKEVDNAIAADPTDLELCIFKANALLEYEKESPDLTLQYLLDLIDRNYKSSPAWKYPGETVDNAFFCDIIQSYCFALYKKGSPASKEAFRALSEKMLKYEKNNVSFLDNIGSYYLVVKDNDKQAQKYYKKALKIDPEDKTALQNMKIIERRAAVGRK